uniref:Ribosomal_L7Ae domain-containing protein n=1 Tax=Haemonchus contortus TaxID=6289 RepID=A0A7I4XTH1_HAECO
MSSERLWTDGSPETAIPKRAVVPSQHHTAEIIGKTDERTPQRKEGQKKKKKKPAKKIGLEEYLVDNQLRKMVGLKKLSSMPVVDVIEDPDEKSDRTERRGIRKEKKLTPTKKKILKARENCEIPCSPIISFPFSPTPLDEMVIDLLKRLKKQTDAIYEVNQTKARAKRTFVCGLHESLKHVRAENVKCVVVARNLDDELITGPSLFHALRAECITRQIPIIHASTKTLLNRAVKKFPYTNVVALFHFQGFEELYSGIIRQWRKSGSHIHYHADQMSLFA